MNLKSQTAATESDRGRQHIVLWHVGWTAFEKILDIMPNRRLRAAYSDGDLEIMSPLPLHEALKAFFGYFLLVLAEECSISMRCLGSTTYRRSDLDRGIEPDQSYYFASFRLIKDWTEIDLTSDPPPDLAVEVEITSSVLDRIEIYQRLRVPELWRCDDADLQVLRMDSAGIYQPSATSGIVPFLPVHEVMPLWQSLRNLQSDVALVAAIREWVRKRVLPLHQEWLQSQS